MDNKFRSIEDLIEDGEYEIHIGTDERSSVSGIIVVKGTNLYDKETGEIFSDKDIWDVTQWEEENSCFYVKIK